MKQDLYFSFLEIIFTNQGHVAFFPRAFYMKQDSCCVLSKIFSHETGFMLCSFPEVFSCHRVHVLFFPRDFFIK